MQSGSRACDGSRRNAATANCQRRERARAGADARIAATLLDGSFRPEHAILEADELRRRQKQLVALGVGALVEGDGNQLRLKHQNTQRSTVIAEGETMRRKLAC